MAIANSGSQVNFYSGNVGVAALAECEWQNIRYHPGVRLQLAHWLIVVEWVRCSRTLQPNSAGVQFDDSHGRNEFGQPLDVHVPQCCWRIFFRPPAHQ